MIGITMKELIECVSNGHDAEFTYQGKTYVLQPEKNTNGIFLVIWIISPESKCICSYPIPEDQEIPPEIVENVLNEKCFNGKSFMEIERQITVEVIY